MRNAVQAFPVGERMRGLVMAIAAAAVLAAPVAEARSSGGTYAHSGAHGGSSRAAAKSHRHAAPGVARHSHGHIKRSEQAKHDFRKAHPCPSTGKSSGSCPGYVIDHVKPLKRGGADAPDNMQWQTQADAKLKDRWE